MVKQYTCTGIVRTARIMKTPDRNFLAVRINGDVKLEHYNIFVTEWSDDEHDIVRLLDDKMFIADLDMPFLQNVIENKRKATFIIEKCHDCKAERQCCDKKAPGQCCCERAGITGTGGEQKECAFSRYKIVGLEL